jgi:hypothetical protein
MIRHTNEIKPALDAVTEHIAARVGDPRIAGPKTYLHDPFEDIYGVVIEWLNPDGDEKIRVSLDVRVDKGNWIEQIVAAFQAYDAKRKARNPLRRLHSRVRRASA